MIHARLTDGRGDGGVAPERLGHGCDADRWQASIGCRSLARCPDGRGNPGGIRAPGSGGCEAGTSVMFALDTNTLSVSSGSSDFRVGRGAGYSLSPALVCSVFKL
jgi:hypothetical protein